MSNTHNVHCHVCYLYIFLFYKQFSLIIWCQKSIRHLFIYQLICIYYVYLPFLKTHMHSNQFALLFNPLMQGRAAVHRNGMQPFSLASNGVCFERLAIAHAIPCNFDRSSSV